ncbi:MAG: tyrosine-type recombinase/integrase [Hyphomicrobiaceae bacterium]
MHQLTNKQVENAKAGMHADGGGLYRQVDRRGKRWVLRLTIAGKRTMRGHGSYSKADGVTLAEARVKAAHMRKAGRGGVDVRASNLDATDDTEVDEALIDGRRTVAQTFEEMFATRLKQLSNGKHVAQWTTTLADHAFPVLGNRPAADITLKDVEKALKPIWRSKAETARRVLQRIEATMQYAIAAEYREKASPTEPTRLLLGKQKDRVKHHPALPLDDVPVFPQNHRSGLADVATGV